VLGVAILSKGVGALGVEIEPTTSPETSFEPNAISLAPSSSKSLPLNPHLHSKPQCLPFFI
jgi:hypothetical protein